VASWLAVRIVFSSGLKIAVSTTSCVDSARVRSLPVVASQSRAVRSQLEVRTVLLSRLQQKLLTVPPCGCKAGPIALPCARSHHRIVAPPPPGRQPWASRSLPSGLNARGPHTRSRQRGSPLGSPVRRSQSRTTPSTLDVTPTSPLGLESPARTSARCLS